MTNYNNNNKLDTTTIDPVLRLAVAGEILTFAYSDSAIENLSDMTKKHLEYTVDLIFRHIEMHKLTEEYNERKRLEEKQNENN